MMMCLVCSSLNPTSLGLSELPGLICLFPLLGWRKSLSLFVQINFQFLALPLLLLAPLWFGCCNIWSCPRGSNLSLSFFWILISSFCSSWMFLSSFCSKSLIWVPVSFPSLLVPCIFFFISLYIAFISYFILWPHSTISVSILITSVLNSASDRLAISSSLSSFSGVLIYSFIWAIFLCLSTPVTL